jgi:import inner membrane translocase subunit TIM13
MALFGSSSSSNAQASSPAEVKNAIIRQLQQEAAMANARNLIGVCLLPSTRNRNSPNTIS